MDKRIRKNELCIIGLPRCDYVFSSTRSCFIGYGFEESPLEKDILIEVLKNRGIEPLEAGGSLAPGQHAFCTKICSKIIPSQFCIILLNNDEKSGTEIPNANVNMEYGMMLVFNKYVIPFQRKNQKLPFNVAGLDTIKYTNSNFKQLAEKAIDLAIKETNQDTLATTPVDQYMETFLIYKKMTITPLHTEGDKNIYEMGRPLGFNLLNDFTAFKYVFFGNFTAFRPEVILWRLKTLQEILNGRKSSMDARVSTGLATEDQAKLAKKLFEELEIWVAVTGDENKTLVSNALKEFGYKLIIFSINDIRKDLENLVADTVKFTLPPPTLPTNS